MNDLPAPEGSEPTVSRLGVERVIRRAIELSLKEQDEGENLSEAELVKIAEELGLSERHVRQALYERDPDDQQEPSFLDSHFGPTRVVTVRAVHCDSPIAHTRLEDYLVTQEYLQIRRRQGPNAYFEPADDAFSSLARAFSFTTSRSNLARAQSANLTVRPLEAGWCHVRLEVSYPDRRKGQVLMASILGSLIGLAAGAGVGAGVILGMPPGPPALTAGVVAAAATTTAAFSGFWVLLRSEYRKWLGRSRDDADAVLDRLEHGDDLRPPTAPWLRRLQQRLRGFGSRSA